MTKKIILLKSILSILFLLTLFSCREEAYESSLKTQEKNIAQKTSYDQFLKTIGSTDRLTLKVEKSSKDDENTTETFTIDSTKILLINDDAKSVFSMRLIADGTENKRYFYNLYVEKTAEGDIIQTIVEYEPSLATIMNKYRNFTGNYKILNTTSPRGFTNERSNCSTIEVVEPCEFGNVHEHDGPDYCEGNGSYTYSITVCSGGGGGSLPGDGGSGPNGPGGGGPGTGVIINPYESGDNSEAFNYISSLYYQNKTWADKNSEIFISLTDRVYNDESQENKDFIVWGLAFFQQNSTNGISNVSWTQFQNWFMGTSEGKDGEYIDPDLIEYETPIVQQSLPTLAQWYTSFPKIEENGYWKPMESPAVYQLAGGSLYTSHINDTNGNYQNACAIRGSRGLIYSGITIPVIKRSTLQLTQKGGDGKNYILAATTFLKFMKDTFGDTPHKLENADANDPTKVANLLKGKSGIYVIENADPRPTSQGGAGYSGHVDNIVNGICISGAYTQPKGGVKSIRIWVLN